MPADTPLKDQWTFWSIQRSSSNSKQLQSENYETYLKCISTISTVQDFWSIYLHTKDLPSMFDLHLFRASIRPVWEDPANAQGGKITLRLRKGLAARLWEALQVVVLGEEYEIVQDICGIILSNRYQEDIISIWIGACEDAEILKEFVKKVLGLPPSTHFDFKPHNVSISKIVKQQHQ